jgi:hypothetical protein
MKGSPCHQIQGSQMCVPTTTGRLYLPFVLEVVQNQHTTRMSFFSNSSRILAMDGPFSRYPETFFVLLLAFFSVAYRVGHRQNISIN